MGSVAYKVGPEYDDPVTFLRHTVCKNKLVEWKTTDDQGFVVGLWCPDCRRDVTLKEVDDVTIYNVIQQIIPSRLPGDIEQLGVKPMEYHERLNLNKW